MLSFDSQSVCGCITYLRRYGLMSAVGIAPDDDDGNAVSGRTGTPEPKKPKNNKSKIDFNKIIVKDIPTEEDKDILNGIYDSVKSIMPDKFEVCVEAYKLMDNHWPDTEKAGWVIEQLQELYGKDAA